jgi:TolB-like protein
MHPDYPNFFTADVIKAYGLTRTTPISIAGFATRKRVKYAIRRKAILQGLAMLVHARLLKHEQVPKLWAETLKKWPKLKESE